MNAAVGLWLSAQAITPWRDPSPHQVRFVSVDKSVRLEVLDWGGTGRPLLFVGCYLTAHVYDDIAPKLTDQFHVFAVTRRGVGASDHPPRGYDPQRCATDILEVIGALAHHFASRCAVHAQHRPVTDSRALQRKGAKSPGAFATSRPDMQLRFALPTIESRVERRPLPSRLRPVANTFRAPGITAYLENGGTTENSQTIAAHESPPVRQ